MVNTVDLSKDYRGNNQIYEFFKLSFGAQVEQGQLVTPDTTPVYKLSENESGEILRAYGSTLPSAEAGFVQGCMFLWLGAAAGQEALYENVGDESSCSFEAIGEPTELEKKPVVTTSEFGLVDNDNANNGARLMIKLNKGNVPLVNLVADLDEPASWSNSDDAILPIFPEVVVPQGTTTVLHDTDPGTNLNATQVYAKYIGKNRAILVSDTDSGNHSFFADSNGEIWPVMYDADAAEGIPVYFDEDAADADSKLLLISPIIEDLFFETPWGFIKLTHSADAATDGVLLYIDDNGATPSQKLCFVSPTTSNGTITFMDSSEYMNGSLSLDYNYLPIYFDEDAVGHKFQHAFGGFPFTLLIPIAGQNAYLSVGYNADAATDGVSVFVNSAAGDFHDYVEFTSPTDTDGTVDTNQSIRPFEETVAVA